MKESQILFTVDLHVPKDQMVCLRINKAYDFEEKIKEGGYVKGGSDLLSSSSFSKFVWMVELVFP